MPQPRDRNRVAQELLPLPVLQLRPLPRPWPQFSFDALLRGRPRSRQREVQKLCGTEAIEPQGLWHVAVAHGVARNYSSEEIDVVSALASSFVNGGELQDHKGVWHPSRGRTSLSSDEASRGMEFLYSANRLNVVTSRAQCASVLVASPKLLEPECHTPRQIRLANAFCRYLEMAKATAAGAEAR